MDLNARLTAKVGRVFTKVWNRLEDSTEVLLLKPSEDATRDFEVLLQLESKWFFEYSNFRGNFLLEIADTSTDLTDAIGAATHIQIDDDFYSIRSADTTPPKSTDVTWKLYCDKFEQRAKYGALY